jgi:hypothetical protein
MAFASPLWLLGLLPWAGLCIWLLLGRRRRVGVPFIQLWRGGVLPPRAKPFLTRPPLPVLLAIFSLLLLVLASAGPIVPSRGGAPMTIIVDRGITMSAHGTHAQRFKETCDLLSRHLSDSLGDIQMISVPKGQTQTCDAKNWNAAVAAMTPTLEDSCLSLEAAIGRALAQGDANIVVVSDQPILADSRVIKFEPEQAASNLTIAAVAARATPHPQIMVGLRDQASPTEIRQAKVRVESAGHHVQQIAAVPRNGTATAFLDLPALGPVVQVDVIAPDDLPADNHAWLARENPSVLIDDSPALPAALRQMIAVYRRHREVDAGAERVAVVTDAADLPADQPGVVIASDGSVAATAPLQVEADPLTPIVDWSLATQGAAGGTPPADYHPIVSKGDAVFVAVRQEPERGVWVCLNAAAWAAQPAYVIFWTNVFDSFGGGSVYRWHALDGRPHPGIERTSDGSMNAYNAIDITFPKLRPNDWTLLRHLSHQLPASADLAPCACLLGLILMAIAIVAFTRSGF